MRVHGLKRTHHRPAEHHPRAADRHAARRRDDLVDGRTDGYLVKARSRHLACHGQKPPDHGKTLQSGQRVQRRRDAHHRAPDRPRQSSGRNNPPRALKHHRLLVPHGINGGQRPDRNTAPQRRAFQRGALRSIMILQRNDDVRGADDLSKRKRCLDQTLCLMEHQVLVALKERLTFCTVDEQRLNRGGEFLPRRKARAAAADHAAGL